MSFPSKICIIGFYTAALKQLLLRRRRRRAYVFINIYYNSGGTVVYIRPTNPFFPKRVKCGGTHTYNTRSCHVPHTNFPLVRHMAVLIQFFPPPFRSTTCIRAADTTIVKNNPPPQTAYTMTNKYYFITYERVNDYKIIKKSSRPDRLGNIEWIRGNEIANFFTSTLLTHYVAVIKDGGVIDRRSCARLKRDNFRKKTKKYNTRSYIPSTVFKCKVY